MNVVREAAQFIRQSMIRLRSGETEHEPLTVLRLEWRGDTVECDWLMRGNVVASQDSLAHGAQAGRSEESLSDALALRDLIFDCFSAVIHARLRMFRANHHHGLELMLHGHVQRFNDRLPRTMPVVVRAQKAGFVFQMCDGVLWGPIDELIQPS